MNNTLYEKDGFMIYTSKTENQIRFGIMFLSQKPVCDIRCSNGKTYRKKEIELQFSFAHWILFFQWFK